MALWATRTMRVALAAAPWRVGSRTRRHQPRHGRFRGSGPDQQAQEQLEIVPGDMDQVALANILATTQPHSLHAASLKSVGEGAFHDFGLPSRGLLANVRAQAHPVGVDGRARRLITAPTRDGFALRLGNTHPLGATIERIQHGA